MTDDTGNGKKQNATQRRAQKMAKASLARKEQETQLALAGLDPSQTREQALHDGKTKDTNPKSGDQGP